MGGHGGLNILPQKRWNVYNRDNRLKVARDEAKTAAQEHELQAKHRAAEAEARRKLLLQRAKERRAEALQCAGLVEAAEAGNDGTAVTDDEQLDSHAAQDPAEEHEQIADLQLFQAQHNEQQQLQQEVEQEPVLEHINFWKDLEAKAEHPDRQKEKKEEKRKRGNPDTYTTDARFDESFQLSHGLSGPKPWYARAVDPSVEQQWEQIADKQQPRQQQLLQQQQQQQHMLAMPGVDSSRKQRSKRSRSSSPSNSSSSSSDSSDGDSSKEHRYRRSKHRSSSSRHHSSKDRKHKKSHKREKHKKSSKQRRSSPSSADAEKALAVARLRAERLEREAAERHRSLVATGQMPAPTKRYNSSYGYADALKAGNMGQAGLAAARGAAAAAVSGLGQRFR